MTFSDMGLDPSPNIQQHPNQESKDGTPPFASPTKTNSSVVDPLMDAGKPAEIKRRPRRRFEPVRYVKVENKRKVT